MLVHRSTPRRTKSIVQSFNVFIYVNNWNLSVDRTSYPIQYYNDVYYALDTYVLWNVGVDVVLRGYRHNIVRMPHGILTVFNFIRTAYVYGIIYFILIEHPRQVIFLFWVIYAKNVRMEIHIIPQRLTLLYMHAGDSFTAFNAYRWRDVINTSAHKQIGRHSVSSRFSVYYVFSTFPLTIRTILRVKFVVTLL